MINTIKSVVLILKPIIDLLYCEDFKDIILILLQTWRDYKSKVSEKVQKLRKGRAATGNNPVNITISDLKKRILGIIGHEYVQGLPDVPDSFPEECNVSNKQRCFSLYNSICYHISI